MTKWIAFDSGRTWRLRALRPFRLAAVCAAVLLVCALAGRSRQFVPPVAAAAPQAAGQPAGEPIKVLFLGQEKGASHDPASMFQLLAPTLAQVIGVKMPKAEGRVLKEALR